MSEPLHHDPLGEALARQEEMSPTQREILFRAVQERGSRVVIPGPVLGKRMQEGRLNPEILQVLAAFGELRYLEHPAVYWKEFQEALEKVREVAIRLFGVPESLGELYESGALEVPPPDDPAREAFEFVDGIVEFVDRMADRAERILDDAGCRYNSLEDRLETKPGAKGGRPGRYLRALVREILQETREDQNTKEVREMIARELAPFFPDRELGTAKNSPLGKAIDNILDSK